MKRTRQQAGKMARAKGSRAELKIAKKITTALGLGPKDIVRTPNSGALIERSDLRMSKAAQARWPFFVEIKHVEGWSWWQLFSGNLPVTDWFLDAVEKQHDEFALDHLDRVRPVALVLLQSRRPDLIVISASCKVNLQPSPTPSMLVVHGREMDLLVFGLDDFLARLP